MFEFILAFFKASNYYIVLWIRNLPMKCYLNQSIGTILCDGASAVGLVMMRIFTQHTPTQKKAVEGTYDTDDR